MLGGKKAFLPLRKKGDFNRVFELGLKFPSKYLVIYAKPNGLSYCRVGLAVSRKTGNAVERNRTKRRLREIARRRLPQKNLSFDFVIVARSGVSDAAFDALHRAFGRCLSGLTDEKHTDSDNKTV